VTSSVSGENRFWLRVLLLEAGLVLAISFFSGYQSLGLPWSYRFDSTPLGLYYSYSDYFGAESFCSFDFKFRFHFDYAILFLKVLILECPFYFIALRRSLWLKAFTVLVTANFLTHPLVAFGIPCIAKTILGSIFVGELYAPIMEFFILWKVGKLKLSESFLVALIANIFSWQFGIFV